MLHLRSPESRERSLEPLPPDVEVFDEPQSYIEGADQIDVFAARRDDTLPIGDEARRYAYVAVERLAWLGAPTHTTRVEAKVDNQLVLQRRIKASPNLQGFELALQTPRVILARAQTRRRVRTRLRDIQAVPLPENQTDTD